MSETEARVDPKLLEILVCPMTKAPLSYDAAKQELISKAARLAYPIKNGIPIMLVDEARELTDEEVQKIADTYHAWRGEEGAGEYSDMAGFCKSTSLEEIRKHGHVLTPGRYVGAVEQEDDGEPFEEKMLRLSALWREQQATAAKLNAAIESNLKELGYGE